MEDLSPVRSNTFNSLNCSLCKTPYSSAVNHERSAQRLECGAGVCKRCFDIEKTRNKTGQKHRCGSEFDCYWNVKPALFINELLNDPGITANFSEPPNQPEPSWLSRPYLSVIGYFTRPTIVESTNGDGYFLSKLFKAPECPICFEEYSFETVTRQPYALHCGHTICNGCFSAIQNISPQRPFAYHVVCPLCQDETNYRLPMSTNQLLEFLRELPGMIDQLMIRKSSETEDEILQECKNELKKVSIDTREILQPQLKAYDACFPVLQSDLIQNIAELQESLLLKVKRIEDSTFSNVQKERKDCLDIGEEFENLSEEYMMALRLYNTRIKKLKEKIDMKQQ